MKLESNTGGSAFPHNGIHLPGYAAAQQIPSAGMTLRDFFAAGAMQAVVTGMTARKCYLTDDNTDYIALSCYEIADAMVRARGVHA